MQDRVRVGVVGLGYWGPKLVRNLAETPDAELSWVVDLDDSRLARIRVQYPTTRVTDDYFEMLASDVEAVVIATPIRTHYELARAALLRGKHVMVEKPLAATRVEAEELVALADRRGLTLMVGHTFIYHPAVRALRDIIERGTLGHIYYIDMARLNLGLFRNDVNVVWDLVPHDLSILLYMLRATPRHVSARGSANVNPAVHDVAYLEFVYDDAMIAHVHVSWLDPCKVRRITIVGSKKMLVFNDVDDAEKIRIYDKGVDPPFETDEFSNFHLSYRYGDVTIPFIRNEEPLQAQCRHFVECIQTGTRPDTDGMDGLRVVSILEQADRSLRQHGERISLVGHLPASDVALGGVFAGHSDQSATAARVWSTGR
ncbi:MAG: Gfo/Idh/MocA family oxidoreductase [Chloroflexi bacterium]|nr:Gfo/Idh/MocA family oxidoreductase [Chloroflexota bacterium]